MNNKNRHIDENPCIDTPRIVLSGTNSGCGKTTVTLALLSACKRRGLSVQPFKVGPDYIDHSFHSLVAGRASRNLDAWMLTEAAVRDLFRRHTSRIDLAVIEGVMGLYDGYGGTERTASTHHIATLLAAPVILVVGARGMSLSACAMIDGYRRFGGYERIGVIFNGIAGEGTYRVLCQNLKRELGDAVVPLGYLPRNSALHMPERHLGLHVVSRSAEERRRFDELMDALGAQAEESLDIDGILAFAASAPRVICDRAGGVGSIGRDSTADSHLAAQTAERAVRLGVAHDDVFHFYYPDNLERLQEQGAQLVYFSPLTDRLPDVDGLYLGGGYPELHAEQLAANAALREEIRAAAAAGMPIYAECGGLLYLSRSLTLLDGSVHTMCGVLDVDTRMTTKLQRFGYAEATMERDTILGKAGTTFRAHEFHYSEILPSATCPPAAYRVVKQRRGEDDVWTTRSWCEGYGSRRPSERETDNVLASYLHIHFDTNHTLAAQFVEHCRIWRRT